MYPSTVHKGNTMTTSIPGMKLSWTTLLLKDQTLLLFSRMDVKADVPSRGKKTIVSCPNQTVWVITASPHKSTYGKTLYKVELMDKIP